MLNYFQASLIATVGAVGFYFVMVMGMFDFSIGANIMLSAIVGCVLATKFNLGYFGLIVGGILTGTIVMPWYAPQILPDIHLYPSRPDTHRSYC